MKCRLIVLAFVCFGQVAIGETSENTTIRFAGVPALGYSPDSGFGGGVLGSMYIDQGDYNPYKLALGLKVYLSTKGMNSHSLQLDQVDAFGWPLRLTTRLGFFSTKEQNYCGLGANSECDANRAKIAATNSGLSQGVAFDEWTRHYYQNRHMAFFGDVFSRWLLWKDRVKLEFLASYRGRYYWERDFKNKGPYPGSLYERDFRTQKTEGYLSTAEIGIMLDRRDIEAAPESGYWLEATTRGGSWLIGSAWDYFGLNLSARFYIPFDSGRRVVFALQSIADVIGGDLPADAMSRIGGSLSLSDYNAIGGQYIGRGIREQRYIGRVKAIQQLELRVKIAAFDLFKQNFELVPAMFGDFGVTALDMAHLKGEIGNIYAGFGGGLRLYWNKTFVIRADLGVSPSENFSPNFYLVAGNVF